MGLPDGVGGSAHHLADDQDNHRDDESIAGDQDQVQYAAGDSHVVGAHHVPHQYRPHHGIHHHPGEEETPAGECEHRQGYQPEGVLGAPDLVDKEEGSDESSDSSDEFVCNSNEDNDDDDDDDESESEYDFSGSEEDYDDDDDDDDDDESD